MVNMCNPYVCVCQCGCVSLVKLEAAATLGDTLPPLRPIPPHNPTPTPSPSCCIKQMGGKAPLSLCSRLPRDNHTAHQDRRPLGHTHSSATHPRKRGSGPAGSASPGSGAEKKRGEERTASQGASSSSSPPGSHALLD